jgi:hypothetical protein
MVPAAPTRYEHQQRTMVRRLMTSSSLRILLLFAAATLAGCAGSGGPEGASADASGSPATWVTRTPGGQSTAAAPAAPAYTIEQARAECWMKIERDKKAPRELEKRSKLVETCASERMAAQGAETH